MLGKRIGFHLVGAIALSLGLIHGEVNRPMLAQDQEQIGVRFSNTSQQRWEMGLEVTAGPGRAQGILATIPIPIDWPEQKVKIVSKDHSDHVRSVRFKTYQNTVKQMVVSIPQLKAGQTARATVVLEIEKQFIDEPLESSHFVLPKRVSSRLRPYLRPSPYIESDHARIKQIANQIVDENADALGQVESIYRWVRTNIRYEFDEQIKSCLTALDAGQGDCEEMSSLFIALCRARKIPARAVWIPGHTYPEFYLEDKQGKGHWFPCQVAGADQFARMSESKPILQKGDRFKVPGHRKPLRYLQPTLTAKNADANPQIKWILKPIE